MCCYSRCGASEGTHTTDQLYSLFTLLICFYTRTPVRVFFPCSCPCVCSYFIFLFFVFFYFFFLFFFFSFSLISCFLLFLCFYICFAFVFNISFLFFLCIFSSWLNRFFFTVSVFAAGDVSELHRGPWVRRRCSLDC